MKKILILGGNSDIGIKVIDKLVNFNNFSFKFSYPISLKYKPNSEIAFLDPETVPLIPSLDKSIVPLILEKIHFFFNKDSTAVKSFLSIN